MKHCGVCGKAIRQQPVVRVQAGTVDTEDGLAEFVPSQTVSEQLFCQRPCYLRLTRAPELLDPEPEPSDG
jgi:hypothetical protein